MSFFETQCIYASYTACLNKNLRLVLARRVEFCRMLSNMRKMVQNDILRPMLSMETRHVTYIIRLKIGLSVWARRYPENKVSNKSRLMRGTVVERRSLAGELSLSFLRETCSWRVTTYVSKPSAIGQPTRPTQPFIPSGSINK